MSDGTQPAQPMASRAGQGARAALLAYSGQLAFGLRFTTAVCLALYIAFWLQVENPGWAGTSAAISCQPVLGAALRKGQFRFVGTIVGAVFVVLLSAGFPQQRIVFLGGLVAWAGLCSFVSSLVKGPASYAAQLAGYTAAIIADSSIANPNDAFMLALNRSVEITIGVVCATVVLALTDRGHSGQRLADTLDAVTRDVRAGFRRTLASAGATMVNAQIERRALIMRIAAIDGLMDNALGESTVLRLRLPVLQAAFAGLFGALSGWRTVALHLHRLEPAAASAAVAPALLAWPVEAAAHDQARDALHRAGRTLFASPAQTPTARLIADQTAAVWRGLARGENALALLRDPASARRRRRRQVVDRAPDPLPALINAGRVMVAISLALAIWVLTAWPSGLLFVTFVAVPALLLAPQNEAALPAAVRFAAGSTAAAVIAAVIEFGLLPHMTSYAGFCLALGSFLVPLGALLASPRWGPSLTAAAANVVPILSPTNQIRYDTAGFYNTAVAITGGCIMAAVILWLIPPLSPALRADRLARATLRDLRRLARGQWQPGLDTWQTRLADRLASLPQAAAPLPGARIVTALLVGGQLLRLQVIGRRFGLHTAVKAAADAFAAGRLAEADRAFRALDAVLAAVPPDQPGGFTRLRGRAALREIIEAMAAHPDYFGAPP